MASFEATIANGDTDVLTLLYDAATLANMRERMGAVDQHASARQTVSEPNVGPNYLRRSGRARE